MSETILLGRGRRITEIPREMWEQHLAQIPQHTQARLSFMSEEHHRVRYFVVKELPRRGEPIEPEVISQALALPLAQVEVILDELEKNLFFLTRNQEGAVSWAYPVTVDPTPHRLSFSTGERLYGAGAEDAIATPFVQGQLRGTDLSITIATECAHCNQSIEITVDSELKHQTRQGGAKPLVFSPQIDWNTFTEPNIIHAYGMNSVFFWSEEHAREYRAGADRVEGIYETLEQSRYATPIIQGALFAFE